MENVISPDYSLLNTDFLLSLQPIQTPRHLSTYLHDDVHRQRRDDEGHKIRVRPGRT